MRLAIGKAAGSRPASSRSLRSICTSSANFAVESEPAPMNASPIWAVRLRAFGWWAPNQSGGGGVFTGLGFPEGVLGREKSPPQGAHRAGRRGGGGAGVEACGGVGGGVPAAPPPRVGPPAAQMVERGEALGE